MPSPPVPTSARKHRTRFLLVAVLTVLVAGIGIWDWMVLRGAWPGWQPQTASLPPAVPEAAPAAPGTPAAPARKPPRASAEPATAGSAGTVTDKVSDAPAEPAVSPDSPQPIYIWRMTPPPENAIAAVPMRIPPSAAPPAPQRTAAMPRSATPPASAAAADLRRVTALVLNVRAGPSADAERVGRLAKGATVAVLEAPGRWVRISADDGVTGWVSSRYLRPL
jgi:hypothetical protein